MAAKANKRTAGALEPLEGRYPKKAALRDGRSCTLRLMDSGDREVVLSFARALSPDDLLFLRTNITEPGVIDNWLRNIEEGRT
ncbi:MAG: hypothetical protein WEC33_05485, partial [Dehalococcoidia bacterium]